MSPTSRLVMCVGPEPQLRNCEASVLGRAFPVTAMQPWVSHIVSVGLGLERPVSPRDLRGGAENCPADVVCCALQSFPGGPCPVTEEEM